MEAMIGIVCVIGFGGVIFVTKEIIEFNAERKLNQALRKRLESLSARVQEVKSLPLPPRARGKVDVGIAQTADLDASRLLFSYVEFYESELKKVRLDVFCTQKGSYLKATTDAETAQLVTVETIGWKEVCESYFTHQDKTEDNFHLAKEEI